MSLEIQLYHTLMSLQFTARSGDHVAPRVNTPMSSHKFYPFLTLVRVTPMSSSPIGLCSCVRLRAHAGCDLLVESGAEGWSRAMCGEVERGWQASKQLSRCAFRTPIQPSPYLNIHQHTPTDEHPTTSPHTAAICVGTFTASIASTDLRPRSLHSYATQHHCPAG